MLSCLQDPTAVFANQSFSIPDEWKGYPAYKEITHNKYASNALRNLIYCFESPPECGCVKDCGLECCNRALYMECDPASCPTLRRSGAKYCANSVLQQQKFPITEVCRTRFCGFGLRLLESVVAGTIIMEYTGEVIDTKEFDRRRKGLRPQDDFYFASLCKNFMLDAKPAGSRARFANHSCKPNCELQKWSVLGEPRLALVAIDDLEAGTELTYNYRYSEDGMDKLELVKRQRCLCGHSCCSGVIGGKVEKSLDDKWSLKCEALTNGDRTHALSALKAHLSAAPDQGSAAAIELRRQITEIETWIDLHILCFLHNHSDIVEFQAVQGLLSCAPHQHIKCEEIAVLQEKLKLCLRTEKTIDKMNAQIKETSLRLDWNSCISLLRDVHDCLPIRCRGTNSLLLSLQPVFDWAKSLVGHFKLQQDLNESALSNKSGSRYVDEVAKVYGIRLSSRIYFVLETHLEHRLSLYILRQQILSSRSGGVSTQKSIYASVKLSDNAGAPVDSKMINSKTARLHDLVYCVCRLPEDDAETVTLTQCDSCCEWYHPFCINVKSSEENRDSKSKADEPIVKKRKARQNESFVCPFCKLLVKEVSSLATPICGEWFDSFLMRKSAMSCKRIVLEKIISLASVNTVQEIQLRWGNRRQDSKSTLNYPHFGCLLDLDISSTLNAQDTQTFKNENQMPSSKVVHERSGSRKSKLLEHEHDPMSLERIRSVIKEVDELPLVNIPVSFLLQLMEKYTKEWLEEVAAFWCKHFSFLQKLKIDLFGLSTRHTSYLQESLSKSCEIMAEAMYLYSKLRLIEIRCDSEVIHLRLLVWALDASAVLRRGQQRSDLHGDEDNAGIKLEIERCSGDPSRASVKDIFCNRIMHSQRNSPSLVSLDELSRIVQTGYSLLSSCKPVGSHTVWGTEQPGLAFALGYDIAWAVALGLQQMSDTAVESLGLRNQQAIFPSDDAMRALHAISNVVDLKGLYPFARFMNYLMPTTTKVVDSQDTIEPVINGCSVGNIDMSGSTRSASAIDTAPCASSTHDGDGQVHCWCRYAQYGSMIGCDACEQWFHIGCMGLTRGKSKEIDSFLCIRCCEAQGMEYPHKWTNRWSF